MTIKDSHLKDFYKIMDFFKTRKEFSHDRENIQECEYHLANYQPQIAYNFLQRLLAEYETPMNSISEYNSGFKVVITQNSPVWTDAEIKTKIMHFHDYIPAYALKRECKAELAKTILFGLTRGLK